MKDIRDRLKATLITLESLKNSGVAPAWSTTLNDLIAQVRQNLHDEIQADLVEISICTDCLLANAGYATPEALVEPLTKLQGYDIDQVRREDGDLSEPHFSWGSCDGCETALGGDRYDCIGLER